MCDERSALTQKFAAAADGFPRHAVVNAGGNMIINALRQSHSTLDAAELELADLVERMRAALRERHYDAGGSRRVHNIVMPHPSQMFRV